MADSGLTRAPSKPFCVMTVGRSGSTALMQTLRSFSDIATPAGNIACADDELLHPEHLVRYARQYSRLTGALVRTPGQLMQAFYRYNAMHGYAGFKSMPNRHRNFASFVRSANIRFISLVRSDIPSTVASFMVAMSSGCWRRNGGEQPIRWTFDRERHGDLVAANLHYVLDSIRLIRSIPGAIALTYEDLCRGDFSNGELDAYFARTIKLPHPVAPLHASSYVTNWPEFLDFVSHRTASYRHGIESRGHRESA